MKTSVIRYRVADFLSEHPPFDLFSMEELLSFSGTGRVIFHEDDIYLYKKGQERDSVIQVIQQGKVELIDETPAGESLKDVLGAGDIIGLGGNSSAAAHPHTARTATEVILYSFDLRAFEELVGKYPEAGNFLKAHLSATSRQTRTLQATANRARPLTEREKSVWIHTAEPPAKIGAMQTDTCSPEVPIREVARIMEERRCEAIAVTDSRKAPLGFITGEELRAALAKGAAGMEAPAGNVMNRGFATAAAGLRAADYLLEMVRNRTSSIAITSDGTTESSLIHTLTDSDLEIACGRNPWPLMQRIQAAESIEEMSYLVRRTTAFLVEGLAGPSVVEWFSQLLAEFNAAIVERVVQMSKVEMERTGRSNPGLPFCRILFGRAGRGENLALIAPDIGIVYLDPPDEEGPDEAQKVRKYYSLLAQKIGAKLRACGLRPASVPEAAPRAPECRTLKEWKDLYAGLIHDPIMNEIYGAREYFDFRVAGGDRSLSVQLEKSIVAEIEKSEAFIPVLANDTIAKLPPLTFLEGRVIEVDGTLKHTLDVEKTALDPIVDSARVFSLAARETSISNTSQRLNRSIGVMPQYAAIFNEAAEAWRIVSYHHATAELSRPEDNGAIHPHRLSRLEQRLLKTAFDSTRRFLELTNSTFNWL